MSPTASTCLNPLPHISGYSIVEQLYAGSRTLVYRAVENSSQHPVIIKLLQQDYPSFNDLLQFRNQYTLTKHLGIPGIVHPYSLEAYRNSYALVMEDFGGISLRQWMGSQGVFHPISLTLLKDVLAIALQLANILHELHQNHIIHKDIKPANILIHPQTKQVKLIDFSIASLLPKETQEIKNPDGLEGTLAYLAPEQTGRMNRGIDYRADFYALGVTLFELLTGQLPFQSNDPMELVHCHIAKQPPSLGEFNLPSAIAAIVLKLMAKNAEDRYQSALGLKHDLHNCLTQLKETGKIEPFEIGIQDVCDRFLIPEKLYGREAEVRTLLEAFDRVANGTSELMLVAGFSGIGKTAVVNEVHKPIARGARIANVRQRAYFIKGKFDQFNRNIPFSAFVQAFRDLMGQLLSESDTDLHHWKTQILNALGDNGQVIINVIPELEQIVLAQPAISELSGTAAQNRFNLLFQKFIQVFTTPKHPLVMFLDDLQWADLASLNLMQLLMNESESSYLLLIGAYRDNEVSPTHPLMLTLDAIASSRAKVNTITLQPLSQTSLNQLVSNTLNCRLGFAAPLTDLVYQKTKGNPFFATQFLKALYQERLIEFNLQAGHWQCDIVQVREAALTDDVVEFMATQLKKLPQATQTVLKLAACIGNQFDLNTLAIVSQQAEIETATALWRALQEGLILPQSEVYKFYLGESDLAPTAKHETLNYKFLHDRVQQAAYSLIPDDQKQITHLQIGRLRQQATTERERDESLFAIVNHLNKGASLIEDEQEQQELVKLNLAAGQKAKSATAYAAALNYFNTGIALLRSDRWQHQYNLTLALYGGAAESAYLSTDFQQMETFMVTILEQARTLLDTVKVYELQIQVALAQNQLLEAVQIALKILKLLEITFPEQPSNQDSTQALAATTALLAGRKPLDLMALPQMQDANKLAAMRILVAVTPCAYQAAPALLPLLILKQVTLSIQYGNAPSSAFGYTGYGLVLCGIVGDINMGYQFGQLALQLFDQFNVEELKARTHGQAYGLIWHWKEPIRSTWKPLRDAYQSGLDTGDLGWASIAACIYIQHTFFGGKALTDLSEETAAISTQLVQIKQESLLNEVKIFQQSILNLLDSAPQPQELTGKVFDAEQMLPVLEQSNAQIALCYFYIAKLLLGYLFEDLETAIAAAIANEAYVGAASGLFVVVIFSTYDSLAHLALYAQVAKAEQHKILERVAANQKKLKTWADHAPMNHLHKFYLVEAERCRVLGQKAEAIDLYDRAIAEAKANEYTQEEALANELAAKFYLEWGKKRIAQEYLINAYYGYARWGAKAKVVDLEQRYPQLLAPILQQDRSALSVNETVFTTRTVTDTSSSSSRVSDTLDLAAILKASQTLSGEIELGKLLSTLLKLALENAGADKCVLLLMQDDRLIVKGLATNGAEPVVLHQIPVENIPLNLVHTVKRRLEPVVLMDVTTDTEFATDPYFQRQNPKSILCSPILHQGKLLGIVYLENNLTIGAFTNDRVNILNILCAQATISIENARLYERSQDYAHELEQSLEKLSASEIRFQKLADNLPGIIYQLRVAADGSTSTPYISSGCAALYEVPPEDFLRGIRDLRSMEHPDDRPGITQAFTYSAQTLTPFEYELRIVTPSGRVKWIQAASRPERQADGSIVWDGVKMDISDRKQAEQRLQESQQVLQLVLNTIPHQVFWKDLNLVYQGCNQSFADDAGVTPTEIVGKTDYDLAWTTEEADFFRECDRRVMESNTPELNIIEPQLQANGNTAWLETSKSPLHDANGIVIGLLGIYQNISDRKRAEDQLNQRTVELEQTLQELHRTQTQMVQSEKMSGLGQLVAGVAHEINNPVNFIFGNLTHADAYTQDLLSLLQLYQQHYPTPHPAIQQEVETIDLEFLINDLPKLLTSMKVGADRIRKIVASLRNFSRMDEAEMKEVNIHDGIDSTLMILQHRLKAKTGSCGIEVRKQYGELPLVECYAGQLNQVFMNLIGNAIDALEESLAIRKITLATITIRTVLVNLQQVIIEVTDNGLGIPDPVKQRLFDPFFTTKPVGKGTGMGLSISYQIVSEKHKGSLQCISKPGQGATFVITIPVRQS